MKLSKIQIFTGVMLLAVTSTLCAGGFQAWQQSGESVGNYAAGAAAEANDATTAFYNPAGLVRIKHQDAAISTIGKISNVKFNGSVTPSPAITGFTNNGNIQGGATQLIPTILYAAPVSDKWAFGFSMTSPFESNYDYGENTSARYIITKNQIDTIDLGPSIAYQLFHWLSLGAGFDANYFRIQYNQVDTTGGTTANDMLNKNRLSDWSLGWNIGALVEISQDTRAGISYRSQINHHAAGDSEYSASDSHAKLNIDLPSSTIFSIYHSFTDWFDLMGTANFTNWSAMQNLVINNAAGPTGTNNITILQNLHNTWRFILGATFIPDSVFTIRTGIGYDQSPVANSSRNLIFPDSNRYLASLGFGYKLSDTMSVDVGYTHAFMQRQHINQTQAYGAETLATVGSIDSSEDLIGAEFNWWMT